MDADARASVTPPPPPFAAAPRGGFEPDLPGLEQTAIALPLALAAGGALIGALLWAGIAYATGYEIGYVAWAIGGLAGGGMVLGGGRGVAHAALAAGLALGGIAFGKYFGTSLVVDHQLAQIDAMFEPRAFEQMREMAAQMAATPAGELLVDTGYDASDFEQMTPQEMHMFERLRDPSYTFEQWRDETREQLRAAVNPWDLIAEEFDFIDAIFILLGLSTAFGVVQRAAVRQMA